MVVFSHQKSRLSILTQHPFGVFENQLQVGISQSLQVVDGSAEVLEKRFRRWIQELLVKEGKS